jgi:hypothetical protein
MMKKQRKNINQSKYVFYGIVILALGFVAGFVTNTLTSKENNVRVWAVDNTVKIPTGLENYLESNSNYDCKSYRGTDTPTGVALYAVEKVVGNNYVKMSYGCSDNLNQDTYIIAIKQNGKWSLIQPVEYNNGAEAPFCTALEKYHIGKNAEPYCIDQQGKTKSNNIE